MKTMAQFVIRMNDVLGVVDRAIVRMPCSFYERHCAVAVGSHLFTFRIIKNNQDWGSRSKKIREQAEII
jgi:hypothetical protein